MYFMNAKHQCTFPLESLYAGMAKATDGNEQVLSKFLLFFTGENRLEAGMDKDDLKNYKKMYTDNYKFSKTLKLIDDKKSKIRANMG